ncbi:MAG: hypothetical protein FJ267_09555 [Planctomycetes bacterium]|nr:hypothetical protein [Planctomycetota bacterium]
MRSVPTTTPDPFLNYAPFWDRDAILQNVVYNNVSNISPSTRSIIVQVTEGDGGASNLPTKQINVTV